MSWMIIFLFIIIMIVIVVAKFEPKKNASSGDLQYQKQKALFTPAERSFFSVLKLAVNEEVEVFAKVRVADVITPRKNQNRSIWQKSFNKISAKHFDFLLCNKGDLSPICAIELNDSSHNTKKRIERDTFLKNACNSASLPLVLITATTTYKTTEIREAISQYLPIVKNNRIVEVTHIHPEQSKNDKSCPKCSSAMVIKVAKKGRNIGSEFWSCIAFPKCRYIEPKDV